MIVKPESALFNTGSYVISDAAKLLAAPTAAIRRWLPLLSTSRPVRSAGRRSVTFAELIALNVVKLFADAGVRFPFIKQLSQTAGARFGVACPLATKQFQAEWHELIGSVSIHTKLGKNELQKCEQVFVERVGPFLQKVDFLQTGEAARYWPLGRHGRVVLDPERKFGAPIDDESGVPVRAIYAAVVAGGGEEPQTVAEWLDVSLDSVRAAIAFEGQFGS